MFNKPLLVTQQLPKNSLKCWVLSLQETIKTREFRETLLNTKQSQLLKTFFIPQPNGVPPTTVSKNKLHTTSHTVHSGPPHPPYPCTTQLSDCPLLKPNFPKNTAPTQTPRHPKCIGRPKMPRSRETRATSRHSLGQPLTQDSSASSILLSPLFHHSANK